MKNTANRKLFTLIRGLLRDRLYVYLTDGQMRAIKTAIADARFKGLPVQTEWRGLGFVTVVAGDYELITNEKCLRDLKEEARRVAQEVA
jgi:hypothetical protein